MDSHLDKSPKRPPIGWAWFAIIPVVPFMLGAGLMQLSAPWQLGGTTVGDIDVNKMSEYHVLVDGKPSKKANEDLLKLLGVESVSEKTIVFSHLGDQLTYGAAAMLQMMICTGVIVFQARHLWQSNNDVRKYAYCMLSTSLLTVGIMTLVHVTKSAPYQLTYLTIRELLLLCPGWPEQLAADGDGGILFGQSRLFYSSMIPFALGAVAAALMTATAAAIALADNGSDEDWEVAFSVRVAYLQNAFRMASVVLVASTIALMLFVKLPVGLMEEATAAAISHYAQGLTVYWGAIMSLTLIAVFALPVISMLREARFHYDSTNANQTFSVWLKERSHLSVKRHVANLATMMAPVLVGPVGALMQTVFGS